MGEDCRKRWKFFCSIGSEEHMRWGVALFGVVKCRIGVVPGRGNDGLFQIAGCAHT